MPRAAILPLLQLGEQTFWNRAAITVLLPVVAVVSLRQHIMQLQKLYDLRPAPREFGVKSFGDVAELRLMTG